MSYRPTSMVEIEVSGNDQFSNGMNAKGIFNLAIDGTFVATIDLQISFDGGTKWTTVEQFTETTVKRGEIAPNEVVLLRIGSTAYTSGTAFCRISQ